eukprot:5067269-Prymnesium_polylepis.2
MLRATGPKPQRRAPRQPFRSQTWQPPPQIWQPFRGQTRRAGGGILLPRPARPAEPRPGG